MSEPINWLVRLRLAQAEVASVRILGTIKSDEEIYRAHGFDGVDQFWRVQMEERMRALDFVRMLGSYFHNCETRLSTQKQLTQMGLERALCEARESGQPFFVRDEQRPERGPNDLKSLRLDPRAATLWLLSMQRHRHLVPASLIEAMEGKACVAQPRSKGRPLELRNRVVAEMRIALTQDEQKFRNMKEKELEAAFRVSRDTARKARNIVLSENVGS